jgi:helix-turn-helix, Psq domain
MWPWEEQVQLALAAIQELGTKPNGDPLFSAQQAERHFNVSRSSLGNHLKGM